MEAFTAAVVTWAKTEVVGWFAHRWSKVVATLLVIGGIAGFLAITAVSVVSGNAQTASAANACTTLGYSIDDAVYQPAPVDQALPIPMDGTVPGFGPDDGDKISNAQAIIAAGQTAGVGRRGLIVAIATALQESGLENLDHGDRDSLGLFQQRPSQGWGSSQQVRDPRFAALAFFGGTTSPHYDRATGRVSPGGLVDVVGWESLPITVAAQRVQRSAFPDAYAKHEARATVIVDALAGEAATITATSPTTGNATAAPAVVTATDYRANGVDIDTFCSANFELASAAGKGPPPSGQITAAGEWTAPIRSQVTSDFGMRFHPVFREGRPHAGTDFHAAVGTPIGAPTVGEVESVTWSSGGGLAVTLVHADGVTTRHLHLSRVLVKPGDRVQGGQTVALSGDTGVGTGAHYHFEVHVGGKPVDSVPFMRARGVELGAPS